MSQLDERASWDHGFFRARLILDHDEFVEVTEYFVVAKDRVETVEYRYPSHEVSGEGFKPLMRAQRG